MVEHVILVNECDCELGTAEKVAAHIEGKLHRAFSVFLFDSAANTLLQRRATTKYHSAGKWANTCCGHPRPLETVDAAASRRLFEEMGVACSLDEVFSFVYRADVGNGLCEHEYDHVFVGFFDGIPVPCFDEVNAWRWESLGTVAADVAQNSYQYAPWFGIALEKLRAVGVPPSAAGQS